MQYVGFKAKPLVREYTFNVREAEMEPREYTLTITNEAFDSRRARFQDAPDICSLRLHRELVAHDNSPEKTHYRITDAELEEYRDAHSPKSSKTPRPDSPETPSGRGIGARSRPAGKTNGL